MRKLQNDFERMIGMYTAPNGMIFDNYFDSMEYNREEIQKDYDELFGKNKVKCPLCKKSAVKSEVKEIYICGYCNRAFSLIQGEDENESED